MYLFTVFSMHKGFNTKRGTWIWKVFIIIILLEGEVGTQNYLPMRRSFSTCWLNHAFGAQQAAYCLAFRNA